MLAKCSVFIATSLDGFIARDDGSIDWLIKANTVVSPGEDGGYKEFISTVDGLVMGRHSFEKVLSFEPWPYDDLPIVVMSSHLIEIPNHLKNKVSTSSEAPTDLVRRLTREGFKHLYIDGGITIQNFIADNLINELTITIVPVLLGSGCSLFGPLTHDIELDHIETKCIGGGFTQLKYRIHSIEDTRTIKQKNKSNVYLVYDEIIDWFDSHRNKELDMEKFYLELLQNYISSGAEILDVGCGTGEPIAQFLIKKGYKVTGVDASEKMIHLCKKRFPNGEWLLADMRTLNLQGKFHAIIAWHSLFHLPHDDQRMTLKSLASLVEPNGLLIFTSGPEYGEVWGDNGGHDLYHASLSAEEYTQILLDCNFKVLIHKVRDPECGDATVWVAQKNE
ncbi:methyltransferase [Legionella gratiana]|uniref:Methyltransferase n=1 Tax=Legionella gratiana TaxID=45066 RepID=A0A378J7E3_9GAMM|nr:methyltransferase domain-containing protein [Legionella gratiana]KTD10619.1 methyltransferase [Legionella gratiana]STX43545.1 S-adenosyl-L-methionine-dependent methyltransferases [Legionella gratiana]